MNPLIWLCVILVLLVIWLSITRTPIQIGRPFHTSYPRHHRRRGYRPDYHELPLVIGGRKDRNGCLRSAGYSWDREEQKCTRPWISHLN